MKYIHYVSVSRQKGFRGNIAGDGPSLRSTKQYCLDRNGIYITKFRTRRNSGFGIGNYYISDILHAKNEQIFGLENMPDINSIVIELNSNQISRFNKEHIINILRESDLFHIKLSAPNRTNLRDIYRVERDETEVARTFTGIYDFERSYSSLIHAPLKSLIVRWDIFKIHFLTVVVFCFLLKVKLIFG